MGTKYMTLLLLVGALLLSSCSLLKGRTAIFYDSEKITLNRFEQLLNALENQDRNALEEIFSKKSLAEANDFEGSVEYLFELFQGKVESWERDRFGSDGDVEDGKKSIRTLSWYTVTTDKGSFRFYVTDYTIETINPDNLGVYTLHVINAEDADKESELKINWIYKNVAGIYKPE